MFYFHNDYNEACHPAVSRKLASWCDRQMPGYGMDECCERAAALIRRQCGRNDLSVHFLVGGTQCNLTVIDAALRPHQAAVGAASAHINVHETGAVEATGHKVITVASHDGKLTAQQVEEIVLAHRAEDGPEHMAQPKLVYISVPTELGTMYSLSELKAISKICREYGLYLFADGARLGYGLAEAGNDITLADMAQLCDVFYIGGTKMGAMFGEAVVISNPAIAEDFRYLIKQHGGMLAKGWLLGLQFEALFEDGLYYEISRHAVSMADQIRSTLEALGYPLLVSGRSNQIFPILPNILLAELAQNFTFIEQAVIDPNHKAIRLCTSWATTQSSVDALCAELHRLSKIQKGEKNIAF